MDRGTEDNKCPLCSGIMISPYFQDSRRDYLQCGNCSMVFVPEPFQLSREAEKAVYDLHRNTPEDQGYRRFLSRLANPMKERLPAHQSGLDFGCGPGPVLSLMLEEGGHRMSLYDPYYFNESAVLDEKYDFITATEVTEHLCNPAREFRSLFNMLKDGGLLGIMTKLVIDPDAFSRWHYIHDLTHICFYSRRTFEYLADLYNTDLEFIGNDVIIMRKTAESL